MMNAVNDQTPRYGGMLRAHLLTVHRNEAAATLSTPDAESQHYDEHHGVGGLRNHTEPIEIHMWSRVDDGGDESPADALTESLAMGTAALPTQPIQLDPDREWSSGELAALRRAMRPGSQRLPTPNHRPSAHDLAIEGLRERKALGLTRYGSLLQAGNGRDPARDALEEAQDLLCYLTQLREALREAVGILGDVRTALEDVAPPQVIAQLDAVVRLIHGGETA